MESVKGLSHIGIRKADLESLAHSFGNDFGILIGKMEGRAIAACVCLTTQPQSFYYLAATGARGRDSGASYAMVFELLKRLRSLGVKELDLGGVDLEDSRSKGVIHFKKGFTNRIDHFLGEWEIVTPFLRGLFHFMVKLRRRRL